MTSLFLAIPQEGLWVIFIALAYIDPGSGSILLQFLIATVVGTVFYFRRFFAHIVHLIRDKLFRKSK